jgi:hypothetical protein
MAPEVAVSDNRGMPNPPSTRSVKIDHDERGGWSSDGPRRDGAPPRPASLSVRGRALRPSEHLRYAPGSLLVIVSGSAEAREQFAARVIEERGALLSLAKVRALLAGRAGADEAAAAALLDKAVGKRIGAGETVVIEAEGVGAEEREHFVRMAAVQRRPCHLILVEAPRDQVSDEDRPVLDKLRRALDAGELGAEGFTTFLRIGGSSIDNLERVVFRRPSDDD